MESPAGALVPKPVSPAGRRVNPKTGYGSYAARREARQQIPEAAVAFFRKKCDGVGKMRREPRGEFPDSGRAFAAARERDNPGAFTPMTTSQKIIVLAAACAALPAFGADAAANWTEHCAKCHGDTGKGDTKMGRKLSVADLTDPAVQAKFTDDAAVKAMKEGVKDKSDKQTMKPIENLSEADMKALVGYVRSLKK